MADALKPIQFRSDVNFKGKKAQFQAADIQFNTANIEFDRANIAGEVNFDNAIVSGNFTIAGQINATTFNATSDSRLKTNIKPYECKKSILDLPIYEFDYINNNVHTIGCLAQDLQQICPDLVQEDENGFLKISEIKLIYLLLQELKKIKYGNI